MTHTVNSVISPLTAVIRSTHVRRSADSEQIKNIINFEFCFAQMKI